MDIVLKHVSKGFPIFEKQAGFWGSVKSLFVRKKKEKIAVNDLSFQIKQGSFIALLGPNGSGKTTLMKMLSGILVPSAGDIHIGQFIPHERKKSFLKQISLVMGQKSQLWWDLPALDSFHFFASIYGVETKVFRHRLDELSHMLQIEHLLQTPVRKLSLGERMKCELVAALLHQPQVLFLDEPTIGLDIISQQTIRTFLQDYHQKTQATILLTSHNMSDIESLCNDLIILHHGTIVFEGTMSNFKSTHPMQPVIHLRLAHKQNLPAKMQQYPQEWKGDLVLTITVPYNELADITAELLKALQLTSLSIKEPHLDEIMHHFFLTTTSS